uniref:Tetratricopeptide SHNi-TPR domain-containing protein n=1 Tax=Acrobeloides nanus TaxID=290746 RepID=A0A914CI51_9BILA
MAPFNAENEAKSENTTDQTPETREEKIERLNELMAAGKRAFNVHELNEALEKLSEAASLSTEIYGDFAPEVYESHYYYGRTLLDVASCESNLIDNLAPSGKDTSVNPDETLEGTLTEEQMEEIRTKVMDAIAENADMLESGQLPASPEESLDVEPVEENAAPVATVTQEMELPTSQPSDNPQANLMEEEAPSADEDEEGGVDEEEPSSLQLAWEVLEVARKVCEQQGDSKEWELKKADVFATLANCSIEESNFNGAIEDLNQCLAIQQKHLDANDRFIAATYFEIGRAYKLNDCYDLAAENFRSAERIVTARIAIITEKLDKAEESEKAKLEEELIDLKDLLPDLQEKINDAKDSALEKDVKQQVAVELPETKKATFEDAETLAANPAADITNLVRKSTKRTSEAPASNHVKKVKFDEAENLEAK